VEYTTKYKCVDSPEEQETSETEKSFQVSCFISQGEGSHEKREGREGRWDPGNSWTYHKLVWGRGGGWKLLVHS